MMTGKIVRLIPGKSFGFIRPDHGKEDHFFHKDDFEGMWDGLMVNMRVSFITVESNKGSRAGQVTIIDDRE